MGVSKNRTVGKGDARHDDLKAFQKGMEAIQKPANWKPHGTVFLRKNNRTVVKYG
jgi:hypothetical protein